MVAPAAIDDGKSEAEMQVSASESTNLDDYKIVSIYTSSTNFIFIITIIIIIFIKQFHGLELKYFNII